MSKLFICLESFLHDYQLTTLFFCKVKNKNNLKEITVDHLIVKDRESHKK